MAKRMVFTVWGLVSGICMFLALMCVAISVGHIDPRGPVQNQTLESGKNNDHFDSNAKRQVNITSIRGKNASSTSGNTISKQIARKNSVGAECTPILFDVTEPQRDKRGLIVGTGICVGDSDGPFRPYPFTTSGFYKPIGLYRVIYNRSDRRGSGRIEFRFIRNLHGSSPRGIFSHEYQNSSPKDWKNWYAFINNGSRCIVYFRSSGWRGVSIEDNYKIGFVVEELDSNVFRSGEYNVFSGTLSEYAKKLTKRETSDLSKEG